MYNDKEKSQANIIIINVKILWMGKNHQAHALAHEHFNYKRKKKQKKLIWISQWKMSAATYTYDSLISKLIILCDGCIQLLLPIVFSCCSIFYNNT